MHRNPRNRPTSPIERYGRRIRTRDYRCRGMGFRRLGESKPGELRGFVRREGETLSETWSYILPAG